jgi:hypothetical protein
LEGPASSLTDSRTIMQKDNSFIESIALRERLRPANLAWRRRSFPGLGGAKTLIHERLSRINQRACVPAIRGKGPSGGKAHAQSHIYRRIREGVQILGLSYFCDIDVSEPFRDLALFFILVFLGRPAELSDNVLVYDVTLAGKLIR